MSDTINVGTNGARATIQLLGARVTSWVPPGLPEQLFTASKANVQRDSLMAGIPIVFPQFSTQGSLTDHGFARSLKWRLISSGVDRDVARAQLRLTGSDASRAMWPHDFSLELTIAAAAGKLSVRLSVTNTDREPWAFTAALHTFLAVSDVSQVRVEGLQHARYLDKNSEHAESQQNEADLLIDGPVDRVYPSASTRPLIVHDGSREILVENEGFPDVVVWNPGPDVSRWPDFAPGDDQKMLCIEAAIVTQDITLPPGRRWHGEQKLTVKLPEAVLPDLPL